jgi:hypothetical protein
VKATAIACALSLVLAATTYARFGSSYDGRYCDTTIYSQCVAPNADETVSIFVVGSYATQIRWAMANYNSVAPPVQMVEFYPLPPNYSDVLVSAMTSPIAALAWTQCATGATYGGSDASHTRWCTPQKLVYNLTYEASHFPTDNAKRYIACHELGHTVGLRHPVSGVDPLVTCMRNASLSPKYVPTYTTTSTTERAQIASHY